MYVSTCMSRHVGLYAQQAFSEHLVCGGAKPGGHEGGWKCVLFSRGTWAERLETVISKHRDRKH